MSQSVLVTCAAALTLAAALPAHAVGRHVDVNIVDRTTGETLTPILHHGEWWIAGTPGARYGVVLLNRDGQRTLNVISVDGVNAISGDTAAWTQTGYVMDPYQRTRIDGWRKDMDRVAAFEFASLPDSYAARTGRPANVGVIGIAVFDEKRPTPSAEETARKILGLRRDGRSIGAAGPTTTAPAPAPPAEPSGDAQPASSTIARGEQPKAAPPAQADRLGTAHGQIEASTVRNVRFERARQTPDEIVTIHYDRLENLIAMGIVPPSVPPIAANPFPDSDRFVPDPPPRR